MLYPETDRVSPARIAKSEPVIPRVEPPLSVYLTRKTVRLVPLQSPRMPLDLELTDRSHAV